MKPRPTIRQLKPLIDKTMDEFDFDTALAILNAAGIKLSKQPNGAGIVRNLLASGIYTLTINDLKIIARENIEFAIKFCHIGNENFWSDRHFYARYAFEQKGEEFDVLLRLKFSFHLSAENKAQFKIK